MALSFYSNWEMDNLNPILGSIYDDRSEVADALIAFLDPMDVPIIDALFENTQTDKVVFDYAETSSVSNLLPCYSDPPVLTRPDEFGCCKCPKRPRSCGDLYQPPGRVDAFMGANRGWRSTTDFVTPPPAEGVKKSSVGCLSAQSMAAKERRKRISEKTQELGRLVPGGNKMNTAEMFQAAFKYVKFLQAQVGILEVMDKVQGYRGSSEVDEKLQVLVTSPTIQEKLYGVGRCVVPMQAVEALAEAAEIKSTPVISRDLDRFVQSM